MNLFKPFLLPKYSMDRFNIQITLGWAGFYGTALWDKYNCMVRFGFGVGSIRIGWI